jgi:hypothetical protein
MICSALIHYSVKSRYRRLSLSTSMYVIDSINSFHLTSIVHRILLYVESLPCSLLDMAAELDSFSTGHE